MKAIVLHGAGDLRIEERPMPQDTDKVIVKVKAVGICGTEISSYKGTFPMGIFPRVVGHEIAGEIVSVPQNDRGLKVGDRVALEPYRVCGKCYPCSIGRTNCCEHLECIGVHTQGAFSEYYAHDLSLTHKAPDDMTWEEIAMIEPLTIALHGVNRARVKAGEHVVVSGAGPIGILAAQAAAAMGAIPILIDMMDKRLELGREVGIPHTINLKEQDAVAAIREITGGRMAEVVIECAGAPAAFLAALDYAANAGRISLIGYSNNEVGVKTFMFTKKELDILGSRNSAFEFAPSLELIRSGKVNVKALITNLIKFDELPYYIDEVSKNPNDYMKVAALL